MEAVAGSDRTPESAPVPGRIETGRWYKVEVVIALEQGGYRSARCYLDDELMNEAILDLSPNVGLGSWNTSVEYRNVRVVAQDGTTLYPTE